MLSFLENSLGENIPFPGDAARVAQNWNASSLSDARGRQAACRRGRLEQRASEVGSQEEPQGGRAFTYVPVCSFSRKSLREKQISRCLLIGSSSNIPDEDELKVGIIGGGHLGKQLARVLLRLVPIPAERLRISTRRPETLGEEQRAVEGGLGGLIRC